MGSSEFYWSAYLMQMLAVQCAQLHGQDALVDEYMLKANEYIDLHFDAIETHMNNLREFNNG